MSALTLDDTSARILFVSGDRFLVRSDGRASWRLADLRLLRMEGSVDLQQLDGGLLALLGSRRLVVIHDDGSLFGSTDFPDLSQSRLAFTSFHLERESIAFTVSESDPHGVVRNEDLYVLRAGSTAAGRLLQVRADFVGCGWMANAVWHDDWLLYSDTEGHVLVVSAESDRSIDLSGVVSALPGDRSDADNVMLGFEAVGWA